MDVDNVMATRSPGGSDDFDIPVINVLDTEGQIVDTITQDHHGLSLEPKVVVPLSPVTPPLQPPSYIENSDKFEMVPLIPGPISVEFEEQLSPPPPRVDSPKLFIHTADASGSGGPQPGLNARVNRHRRTTSLTSQDGSIMSDSSSEIHSPRSVTPFPVDTRRPSSPNLKVTSSKWIVDSSTGRILSKLPSTIQISCSDAFGHSVAFGTITGRIFVLNFPDALLSSVATRADCKRKTREWDEDYTGFRHKPFFMRSRSSSVVGISCRE